MRYFLENLFQKLLAIILMVTINVSYAQTRIEGLLYLDNNPVSLEIKDGKILSVQPIDKLSDERHPLFIAPGLIDNQVNGFAGVSFCFGGGELNKEGILKATRELWKKGVTTYLPTLTTNNKDVLLCNFALLADSKNNEALLGSIPGYHLEGPYISPEDGYRGAHPLKYVHKPDWKEFMEFYEASGRNILTITIAPELEGAMEFIRKCTAMGITVAIGHHNAPKAIIDEAVMNGAKIATHLGNGCANMINRHNNPLWPQLANDRLMASLICDGFHLRDEEIAVFYKVKGPEKTIITSDVTSFAALPPGEYKNEEGETIELTKEGMLRYPAQNVLYGSASPISRGVIHIMKVTGCSLGEAIQMASTNPARLYGLTDRGSIEPGKRADLILFELGDSELTIRKTFVAGNLVYDSSK
ncbi:MAG: amidohydrolase family protein [Mariniphaga sp.]|nr:amidohydrolase family protein [Mariniphaga sp.]